MSSLLRVPLLSKHFLFKFNYSNLKTSQTVASALSSKSFSYFHRILQNRSSANIKTCTSMINYIEKSIQRAKRIDRIDLEHALQLLNKRDVITSSQAVVLLKATGSALVRESTESRQSLHNQVWEKLQNLNLMFGVDHFNASLKSQIENTHSFSPFDVLESMKKLNIEPNLFTFELLVKQYTLSGDLEGARTVIQFMKDNKISMNRPIYHSLIYANLLKGDTFEANTILNKMIDNSIPVNSETYAVMLSANAELKDNKEMLKLLEKMKSENLKLTANQIFDISYTLFTTGQDTVAFQLFDELQPSKYNFQAMRLMLRLIHSGLDAAAGHVSKLFMPSAVAENISNPEYNIPENLSTLPHFTYLRELVQVGRSFDGLKKHAELVDADLKDQNMVQALSYIAIKNQHSELSLNLLEHMNSLNLPVRPHYFWPIYKQLSVRKDYEAIFTTMKKSLDILSEGLEERHILDSLTFPVDQLSHNGVSREKIIKTLTDQGFSEKLINGISLHLMANNSEFEAIVSLLNNKKVEVVVPSLKEALVTGYKKKPKLWKELAQVLFAVKQHIGDDYHLNGTCFNVIARNVDWKSMTSDKSGVALNELIFIFWENDLRIDDVNHQDVKSVLNQNGIRYLIFRLLASLVGEKDDRPVIDSMMFAPIFHKKSLAELEEMRDIYVRRALPTIYIEEHLFIRYSTLKDIPNAEKYRKILDHSSFIDSPLTYRQMGILEATHYKNLDKALDILKRLKTIYPDFKDYFGLILHISALMIREKGTWREALNQMNEYSTERGSILVERNYHESYGLRLPCLDIIQALHEIDRGKHIPLFLTAMFEGKYIKNGTFHLLEAYIDGFIERENYDMAIEALQYSKTNFNRTPSYTSLINKLIESEDADRLQKVVDILNESIGEEKVLHSLMASFVSCNKTAQAMKISQTNGLRASMTLIEGAMDHFIREDKFSELEEYSKVALNIPNVDRETVFFQLIRGYAKQKKLDKIENCLSKMKSINTRPRYRTLRYINNVYSSLSMDLPFPTVEGVQIETPSPANPIEEEFYSVLESSNMESAISSLNLSVNKDNMEKLSNSFIVSILQNSIQTKKIKDFKRFVFCLADQGAVESLMNFSRSGFRLDQYLDQFLQQQITIAYLKNGQVDELLNRMENDLSLVSTNSRLTIIELLQSQYPEDKYQQFVDCVEKYVAHEKRSRFKFGPLNQLYTHHFLKAEYNICDDFLTRFPEMRERMKIHSIIKKTPDTKMEEVVTRLLEVIQNDPRGVAFLHSSFIGSKARLGLWQEALDRVDQAIGDGLELSDLHATEMLTLEHCLTQNNQTIPWAGKINYSYGAEQEYKATQATKQSELA